MSFADPTRACGSARKAATGCDCTLCQATRARLQAADKASRIRRERGQSAYVDAAPVRAYVQRLLDAGMTRHQVALLAGLGEGGRTIIRNLIVGQPHQGQGPAKRLRPETAAALMAVQPVPCAAVVGATCDATGTRRRIQALMAIGWPRKELARRLGFKSAQLQIATRSRCESTYALAVAKLYDELQNTPGPSENVRVMARGRGYLEPGWWDADTIDDPLAEPEGVRVYVDWKERRIYHHRKQESDLLVDYSAPRDAQVVRLAERGYSPAEIAELFAARPERIRKDLAKERRNDAA